MPLYLLELHDNLHSDVLAKQAALGRTFATKSESRTFATRPSQKLSRPCVWLRPTTLSISAPETSRLVGQQRSAHQHIHKMQHCQIRPDRKSLRQNDQNGYGMIYHGNGLLCKFCLTTTRSSHFEPITTFFIHTSYLTLELV